MIPPLLFPTLLLAVNAAGLRPSTQLPGFPTNSFLAFALAFPFVQGALFATMNAGTDLARDIQTGFLNRLALTPMRGSALLAGHLAGVIVLGLLQAVFYLAVLRLRRRFRVGRGRRRRASSPSPMLIAPGFGDARRVHGAADGHRRGGPGALPVLFVLLFLSSMNAPRNLIEVDWFRTVATVNPVSYLIEGVRSLHHHRLGLRRRCRSGSRSLLGLVVSRSFASHGRCA